MNLEEFKRDIKEELNSMPEWYWTLRRWFLYIVTIEWRYDIKWFFQRRIRGYDNRATWATGLHLSDVILKHLKIFRKLDKQGVPAQFTVEIDDENLTIGTKKFNDTIDKMIEGWEFFANEDDIEYEVFERYNKKGENLPKEYYKEIESLRKEAEANAILFIKYINCLWD